MDITKILQDLFGETDSVWANLLGLLPASASSMVTKVLPFVGLFVCAVLLLFGKKIMPVVKVAFCFVAAFFASEYWLIPLISPLVSKLFTITPVIGYAISAVLAIVAAILSKFIFALLYVGGIGGGVFFALYSGMIISKPIAGISIKGNYLVCGAAAAVVVVLAILLRNLIKKLGTAAVGAYGIVAITVNSVLPAGLYEKVVQKIADLIKFSDANALATYVSLALVGIFALIGFIIQCKTNRKYKF